MRISTAGFQNRTLDLIQQKQSELAHTQEQLASGQRLTRSADDPAAAARGVALDSALEQVTRYQSNISRVRERLVGEEAALDEATEVLNSVRQLAVQAGGSAVDASAAQAIAGQIRSQLADLYGIANRQGADGQALFAGTRAVEQAFSATGAGTTYHGDAQSREVRIGPGHRVADGDTGRAVFMDIPRGPTVQAAAANTGTAALTRLSVDATAAPADLPWTVQFSGGNWTVTGDSGATLGTGPYSSDEAFVVNGVSLQFANTPADGDQFTVQPAGQQDVFSRLDQIATALEGFDGSAGSRAQLTTTLYAGLEQIDTATDHVIDTRASVGNRLQSLDRAESSHEGVAVELMATLSDLRDVDIAEAASRLSLQITALEAAQQTLVRVQGLSLFRLL